MGPRKLGWLWAPFQYWLDCGRGVGDPRYAVPNRHQHWPPVEPSDTAMWKGRGGGWPPGSINSGCSNCSRGTHPVSQRHFVFCKQGREKARENPGRSSFLSSNLSLPLSKPIRRLVLPTNFRGFLDPSQSLCMAPQNLMLQRPSCIPKGSA